jgi:cytochrome c-type biogenesis protein CcmH/NrfG
MSSTDALYTEAEKLRNSGQNEAAIAKLEQLLQAEPNHVLSYLALAVLYGRMKRHEDAVKAAEKACQLDPNDPFHFTALSVTYQRAFAGTQNRQFIMMAEDAMARAHMLQGR